MGWDFTKGATKAQIVDTIIVNRPIQAETEWSNKDGCMKATGLNVAYNTLKHKVVGKVLWTVGEIIHFTDKEVSRKRFIGCYLLANQKDFGWGYKPMSEQSGPFYYSCPLDFLEDVPPVDEEWRTKVRKWHWHHTRTVMLNRYYKLIKCKIDVVRISHIESRKILGTDKNGGVWRLKKDLIGDEVSGF